MARTPAPHADIYLKQLGDDGLFGYQTVDPGQGRKRSQYGYMVLDNDFSKAEFGYDDPAIPASVTFAHEFNHLLQVNYDTFQDTWMLESTATWAEEKVYPEINDYLGYVSAFAQFPGATRSPRSIRREQAQSRCGSTAPRSGTTGSTAAAAASARTRSAAPGSSPTQTDPADFALAAYDSAIDRAGGKGFSREFVPFAAATAEWRTGFGGFPGSRRVSEREPQGLAAQGSENDASTSTTPPTACSR